MGVKSIVIARVKTTWLLSVRCMYIDVIPLRLSRDNDIINKNSSCDNREGQVSNEINGLKFVCVCSEEIINKDRFQVTRLFLACGEALLSKQDLITGTELVSNKLKYSSHEYQ